MIYGMKRSLFFATLVFAMLVLSGNVAKADGFDANFYANKYPDVVAAVGTDPAALYDHYVNFGCKEGRSRNQQEDSAKYQALLEGNVANPSAQTASQTGSGLPYSTYVDVDLASQSMTYYENGQVKLQSPVVTGNPNNGNGTPTGTFSIISHVPGKYLVGPTWNVWVDTWMQFTPNPCRIGLHDATWRSSFGGDIYQSNGSHGCVNLPHDTALALFNMVNIGTPVVVH